MQEVELRIYIRHGTQFSDIEEVYSKTEQQKYWKAATLTHAI
jgi:hypothetical protein